MIRKWFIKFIWLKVIKIELCAGLYSIIVYKFIDAVMLIRKASCLSTRNILLIFVTFEAYQIARFSKL